MRIAFCGSHRVGKTTLLEEVAESLSSHETVDEPYYLLEEDGYEHAEPPTLQDFQMQLERSLATLEEGGHDVLFDRCPADVLAYLLTHRDADAFELEEWLDPSREAMQSLDLIVFVPIEEPDRIALPAHEGARLRRRVHEELERMLLDDPYEFGVEVLVVEGELRARRARVLERVKRL
ncbi:MAG TPA: AAA family ATPase [Polyangiales bacterium]|nr:AAA family ATPase [Polyangiales bacterium]